METLVLERGALTLLVLTHRLIIQSFSKITTIKQIDCWTEFQSLPLFSHDRHNTKESEHGLNPNLRVLHHTTVNALP